MRLKNQMRTNAGLRGALILALSITVACGRGNSRPIDTVQNEEDFEAYALQFREESGDELQPHHSGGKYQMVEARALARSHVQLEYIPAPGMSQHSILLARPDFFTNGNYQDADVVDTWSGRLSDQVENHRKELKEIARNLIHVSGPKGLSVNFRVEMPIPLQFQAFKNLSDIENAAGDYVFLKFHSKSGNSNFETGYDETESIGTTVDVKKTKQFKDGGGKPYQIIANAVDVPTLGSSEKTKRIQKTFVFTNKKGNELHFMMSLQLPKRNRDKDQPNGGKIKGFSETLLAIHFIYQWVPEAPPEPVVLPVVNQETKTEVPAPVAPVNVDIPSAAMSQTVEPTPVLTSPPQVTETKKPRGSSGIKVVKKKANPTSSLEKLSKDKTSQSVK